VRPARRARGRGEADLGEREVAAVARGRIAAQQAAQQRQRGREAGAAFFAGYSAGLVLDRELPPHADAEDEAPVAQVVERRDLLGDEHRVA
jgi:hypothetical protein